MKKIFYISLGFLVLTLIFLGAYNFIFRNNVNNPVADTGKKQSLENENKAEKSVVSVDRIASPLNEDILGATTSDDGMLYYYSLDDKSLKKATLEGKNKTTLLSNLPGTPSRVLWSLRRDKVMLLLTQTSGQNLWYFTDLATKTLVPLKPEISRLAWNNLGDKTFYQYTDPVSGVRTLNISNPDGSDWKKLTSLNSAEYYISSIPQSAAVSFWNRPNALDKTAFEAIGVTGDNRRMLFSEKFGADYLWSPNGTKVLVSASNEKSGSSMTLNVMNSNGGEFQNLSIPTLISKVVWSKDSQVIYYALPGSLPESAVLPNDYFSKLLFTKDTFWKMEIATGKKTRLVDLKDVTQNLDSIDLFLSPSEDALLFTDRATKRLYRIDL